MFYSRTSNYKLEMQANNPDSIANIMHISNELGLKQGMIVANPIPEEYSLPNEEIEKTIEEAIEEMNAKGIKGKEVTPYLLSKIVELTSGKSLESNIALIKIMLNLLERLLLNTMKRNKNTEKNYILITGADSGIGKQFAIQYSNIGYKIILTARNLEKLKAVQAELKQNL